MNKIANSMQAFNPVNVFNDLRGLSTWGCWFIPIAAAIIIYVSIGWGSPWWGILSAVSGVICVALVADRRLTNYFWGVINCGLYGLACYNNQYWGEMGLNWGLYLPFQFVGMYMWSQQTDDNESVIGQSLSVLHILAVATITLIAIHFGEQYLMTKGGRHPTLDSAVVVLSVVATVLMALRFREQWICWILANCCAIAMWVLNVQAGNNEGVAQLLMWVAFLINSVYGAWVWYKEQDVLLQHRTL